MISTSNITMQFGEKPLFEDVSVKFTEGRRYGLIGANGSGKSTFMKILSGVLEPSNGNVKIDAKLRVGVLGQDQFAFEEHTVVDTVIMGHSELWKIKSERDRIYSLAEMSEEDGMKAADLEIQFGELDGYSAEARAGEILLGIGIPLEQHNGPMSAVAPGWKLRVLLAQVLFAEPDIMLLDEPTNNLDINTIRWLEGILNERQCTMIIISHDRHFLNSVCTHMADLDYGEVKIFPGNYDDFMFASTQIKERIQSDNARKKARIGELQTFVNRFSANASKARQATSRVKQIEKLQLEEMKPSSRVSPFMRFEQEKKLHRLAIELESLGHSFDETLFTKLNLMIEAGEKIAIIGPNGAGKTTLLRCLAKDIEPTEGNVKWSENADIGYFAQDNSEAFETDMPLLQWMDQWKNPDDDEQAIRAILGRMLFSRNDIGKSVKVVSGGEEARLMFGKLTLGKHNIMLLDEPTNHLDMESIESLNYALEQYEGTLIFVSHDREFVSSLATRILEFTEDGIVDFVGNYDEYLRSQGVVDVKPVEEAELPAA